jgi:murein DD-endopeptidase MepM/ murein hydrolase activator NlpD
MKIEKCKRQNGGLTARRHFSFFTVHLSLFIVLQLPLVRESARADEPLAVGPFGESFVWPISASATPDRVAYTFGPRRFKMDQRYDFSRGLDILADKGTEVRAVADGEVRVAGKSAGYQQPVVQLRHAKPGDGKQFFYTNYMYLDEATVKAGDAVKQGDVIGRSGLSPNGFQRLHFELRDGGTSQGFAVHPLAALPYANAAAPTVEIHNVTAGKIHSTVELTVSTPADEADFVRLELDVVVGNAAPHQVVYDVNEWNRLYTAKDSASDPLDQPRLGGVEFSPDYFQFGIEKYRLDLTLIELPPAPNAAAIKVSARAVDARGKSGTAKRPK